MIVSHSEICGICHAVACEHTAAAQRAEFMALVEEAGPLPTSALASSDPVLAAMDRARQRPPMAEDERVHMVALAADASEEQRTTEEVMAVLAQVTAEARAEEPPRLPVHFCDEGSQGDIRIACDQSWTEVAWVKDAGAELSVGVWLADDRRLYTFTRERVTCVACLKALTEPGPRLTGKGPEAAEHAAFATVAPTCASPSPSSRGPSMDHEEAAVLATMAGDDESEAAHREQARALRASDVCGVRAARWMGLSLSERHFALTEAMVSGRLGRDERLIVSCRMEGGCGAAAGEPCREADEPAWRNGPHHQHVDRRGAGARAQAIADGHSVVCAQYGIDPECPGPGEPRALPRHLTAPATLFEVISAVNLLALGDREKTTDSERMRIADGVIGFVRGQHEALEEQRERHLEHRNDLHVALSERDGWRLRAERAESDVTYYKRREADIIEACERVADGGQYRADIVSAIQRIRRERDDALARAEAAERDLETKLAARPRWPSPCTHPEVATMGRERCGFCGEKVPGKTLEPVRCMDCDEQPCVCHEAGLP